MVHTISKIAQRLNLDAGATHLPALILLTDEDQTPKPQEIAPKLPAGSAVVLRHYNSPRRKNLAHMLRSICHTHTLLLIIADDMQLASEVKADGLHLPEYRLMSPTTDILRWHRSGQGILTGAIHSPRALQQAQLLGVDAAFLSPVFNSASHPNRHPLGLMRFTKLCRYAAIPVYALGGMDEITAKRMMIPPIVGVPFFKLWDSGPSDRIFSSIFLFFRYLIILGPITKLIKSAVMAAMEARKVIY